jgi:hypothetical protein
MVIKEDDLVVVYKGQEEIWYDNPIGAGFPQTLPYSSHTLSYNTRTCRYRDTFSWLILFTLTTSK